MSRALPIIFSAPMVRALLAGRKTMTRRVAWRKDPKWGDSQPIVGSEKDYMLPATWQSVNVGDHLYVREAWRVSKRFDGTTPSDLPIRRMTVMYEAGGSIGGTAPLERGETRDPKDYQPDEAYPETLPSWAGKLRPSIFLPRWASRLTLAVTATKAERLKDISEEDAIAEGCGRSIGGLYCGSPHPAHGAPKQFNSARAAFFDLWRWLHDEESWDDNPELVALTFAVEKRNIDS